jgi:hypothetical protein
VSNTGNQAKVEEYVGTQETLQVESQLNFYWTTLLQYQILLGAHSIQPLLASIEQQILDDSPDTTEAPLCSQSVPWLPSHLLALTALLQPLRLGMMRQNGSDGFSSNQCMGGRPNCAGA